MVCTAEMVHCQSWYNRRFTRSGELRSIGAEKSASATSAPGVMEYASTLTL